MKKSVSVMFAVVLAMFVSSAMADSNADEVFAQCKQDAANAEVAAPDMDSYVRKCMEDNGVDASDIDSAMKSKSE